VRAVGPLDMEGARGGFQPLGSRLVVCENAGENVVDGKVGGNVGEDDDDEGCSLPVGFVQLEVYLRSSSAHNPREPQPPPLS